MRTPAPTAYPKVRLIFCRARCPHRAVPGRPRCAAPTAKTNRKRWFGKLRRRNGAALALIFHRLRARWPGGNCGKPLKFCAPEGYCPPRGITLVNGVRGKRSYGHKVPIGRVPGGVLVNFSRTSRRSPTKWVRREEEEQGNERSFRRQAETEWSGLCDDEPPRAKSLAARRR